MKICCLINQIVQLQKYSAGEEQTKINMYVYTHVILFLCVNDLFLMPFINFSYCLYNLCYSYKTIHLKSVLWTMISLDVFSEHLVGYFLTMKYSVV
jgi:hypothetical protein